MPIDMMDWLKKIKKYMMDRNEGNLFTCKDQIVLVDSDHLNCPTDHSIGFDMMVNILDTNLLRNLN